MKKKITINKNRKKKEAGMILKNFSCVTNFCLKILHVSKAKSYLTMKYAFTRALANLIERNNQAVEAGLKP